MAKFAKFIRVITVPILLFFILIVITYFLGDCFTTPLSFWVPTAFIGILPFVSYIISFIFRKVKKQDKEQGRKLQRTLAFIFSVVGYTIAFFISLGLKFSPSVMELTATYFFTIVLLVIFNLLRLKASGHAGGIVGPMLLLCHYFGWIYLIPCALIYVASFWSSVYLKRHTILQFLIGTACATVAFIVSIVIF